MRNSRKLLLMVWCVILAGYLWPARPVQEHEKIVEKVGVNWWLAPLMAVDKDGNAVTDLKPEEIKVFINKTPVPRFVFFRSIFDVSQETSPVVRDKPAASVVEKEAPKGRMVFLLFDLTMSRTGAIGRARLIARSIIANAAPDIRFVVMTIKPFIGLSFELRGNGGSRKLIRRMEQRVKLWQNARTVDQHKITDQYLSRRGARHNDREQRFFRREAANYFVRRSANFFKAFKTLYFHLNGIPESKLVYFFSEGIANDIRDSFPGGVSFYDKHMKESADFLSRCGAVLFVVNAMGVDEGSIVSNQFSTPIPMSTRANAAEDKVSSLGPGASGQQSMQYLAEESGGRYIEGSKQDIVKRLKNIHGAFYEIYFPDVRDAKGVTRDISISTTRKGVTIISVRSAEGKKSYAKMSKVEKELLALNLVMGNPLVKRRITPYNAVIHKKKKSGTAIAYTLQLPASFREKSLDLYKVLLNPHKEDEPIKEIKKEKLETKSSHLTIRFTFSNQIEKKMTRAYFVLVEPVSNAVRVMGKKKYPLAVE